MGIKAILRIQKIILEKIGCQANGIVRILDLGCGKGAFTSAVSSMQGTEVYGTDIDLRSIQYAVSQNSNGRAHYFVGNLESLALKHSFDVLICTDVIEHMPDTVRFVHLLNSLLKPDGILLLGVPNAWGPFELLSDFRNGVVRCIRFLKIKKIFSFIHRRMMKDISETQSFNLGSPHVQHFHLGSVVRLFRHSGFKLTGVEPLSFIIISLLMNTPLGLFFKPSSKLFIMLEKIDGILVDFMPRTLAGSWLFEIRKKV